MSHRAEQIVEAMQAAIAGLSGLAINSNNVHVHRTLSLDENAGELDAITVNIGDDDPVSEFGTDNLAYIDSVLEVSIVAYCKAGEETDVRRALTALRRQIHIALMTNDTLSLLFVIATRYGGASAPEINTDGESPAGKQESRWRVLYRMNITDPGD